MEEKFRLTSLFKIVTISLTGIGILVFIWGFITDAERTWANYLLNNFYFLSLAIGAAFFLAIQSITQSGWSSGFKRVPEAMSSYIPVSALFFLLLIFGIHTLYHWSHTEVTLHDELINHKRPYLNISFFTIRLILFFILWILLTRILRRISLKEDMEGGLTWFEKTEFWSKVFIFVLALTFSLAAFDWIMSINPHWYSTVFAAKNFISAFFHGSAIIILIVLFLNDKGHFAFLNKSHLHDFTRYIFILAIIWGYLWFAQFMLIWYGNIPEETVYYVIRWENGWKLFFFLNIILNWAVPFVVLMPKKLSRSKLALKIIIIILIIGQWIDLYMQIMPETVGEIKIGLIEIGTFVGYCGLFLLVVFYSLSKANLIPRNHPYLEESLEHHF